MPDIFKSAQTHKSELNKDYLKENTPKHEKQAKVAHPPSQTHNLPGHTHNPLASYCYYPDYVQFINEDPEEKVILILRKHPISNLNWLVIVFFMTIAPAFLPLFSFFTLLPFGFQVILALIWYLITFAFILEKFLSWFFHVNLITDERVVEVDFVNLFYREVTDANIDQIQDVTVEVGGAIRTYLHYGDVVIQTASEIPKIEFEDVPNPDKVARVLRELRLEEEQEKLQGRVR